MFSGCRPVLVFFQAPVQRSVHFPNLPRPCPFASVACLGAATRCDRTHILVAVFCLWWQIGKTQSTPTQEALSKDSR